MTRESLFALAVAFDASSDPRHLQGLDQADIETVLSMVSDLRDGRDQAWILAEHARPTRAAARFVKRGVQVPARAFTTRPVFRRDVLARLERDPAVTDVQVDDYHRFWDDQRGEVAS